MAQLNPDESRNDRLILQAITGFDYEDARDSGRLNESSNSADNDQLIQDGFTIH